MCPSAPRVCSEPGGQKPVLYHCHWTVLDNYSPWLIYIISSLTSFDPSIEVHIFMVIRSNPHYIYFNTPLIVESFSTQCSCASFTRRLSSANIWYWFDFISGFIVWWMFFDGQLSNAHLGPTLVNGFWGAAVRCTPGTYIGKWFLRGSCPMHTWGLHW